MAKESKIEWTDATFNPWIGCTQVSPACVRCYAETLDDKRFSKTLGGASKEAPVSHWGKGAPRYRTSANNWKEPLKWNRFPASMACDTCCLSYAPMRWDALRAEKLKRGGSIRCFAHGCTGTIVARRPRVFCASLADWLDDEVPIEWLADLLDLIRRTPNLDWLLLTKRPQNFFDRQQAAMMYAAEHREKYKDALLINWLSAWWVPEGCEEGEPHRPPLNVWIGTTVEDQTRADQRIPLLLSIPAKVRFLSCEPLLGPVDLRHVQHDRVVEIDALTGDHGVYRPLQGRSEARIHWVICGSESGSGRRSMEVAWAESLAAQCSAAGVAFFMKQMEVAGKISGEIVQFPSTLQVREFPNAEVTCG